MSLVEDVERVVTPVLSVAGVELVHLEYQREPSGWILRFYLDKPGGISLDDCSQWNDRLGQLIEENQLIAHHYSLEVSSPGLDRPLRKQADFQKYLGEEAVVKLYAAQAGQKNFHGKMVAVENEELVLDDRTSGAVRIPLKAIASAKLDPKIEL